MTENLPAVQQTQDLITFDTGKMDLIKRTMAKGATNDEFELFMHQCKRTGLDPLNRQIYFQKHRNKDGTETMTTITGIDGYRLIADRTKLYAGNDDQKFDNEDKPTKATATVYKIVGGQRCPFTATALMKEYKPDGKKGFMWNKMPRLMLGKCAEALALRKAFPAELGGLYTDTEMEQAHDTLVIEPPTVDTKTHKDGLPFDGKKPAEVTYTASGTQIQHFTDLVKKFDIDPTKEGEWVKKLSDACKGKPMDSLYEFVKEQCSGKSQ